MQRCLLSSHYFPAFGLEWNKMEEEVVIKSYHVIRKKELKRKLHREHKREIMREPKEDSREAFGEKNTEKVVTLVGTEILVH